MKEAEANRRLQSADRRDTGTATIASRGEAQTDRLNAPSCASQREFQNVELSRLLNHDCDSLTYGGASYGQDAAGAFNVPADVAVAVTGNTPGGFYRAGPAPAPASPLPFNPVFNVSGGVTVADDLSGRVLMLELAHAARMGLDNVPLTDSAGKRVVLSTAECRALSGEFRTRLLASL